MKVLVLGHNGMLGRVVLSYLNMYYQVDITQYRYPSKEFINDIHNFDGDWVVNCIGAIPHKYSEFDVNYELPVFLDTLNKFKIIHSSTDDESGDSPYSESKRIASKWLLENSKNTYSIKSSIGI
jgi:nucleoside-diphosphate-sugar epimerase